MKNRKSGLRSMCGRLLAVIFLASFAALPSSAESFLVRCGIVGEHGGYWVNYDGNPKGNGIKFGGDDKLNYYSTTCFVKPGETARVLINPYAESKPIAGRFGAGSCDIVFTVNNAVYEGKQDDKRRGDGWKLPVKPGWNKAVIKVDAYAYNNGNVQHIGSMSQEVSFFVFVIQVERAGQLRSPFSGYPEVNSGYMMPSHDGTVYACLTCFTRPRGGGSKYALVHMEQSGRIIKIYAIHPDVSSSPVAYDSEGGLYVNVMERIVRFNPDGSFDRSIVSFNENYEEEITGRHLEEKVYPTTVNGKKTLTPAYPDLHPSASCSEMAVNGKYVYLVAAQRKNSSNYDDVLCRLDLESGKVDVLSQVNVLDGPVPGPNGLVYMRSKPVNKGKSPRGTTMCDVLGFDANGRPSSSFTIANAGYDLDGFDGAGCLYNSCVVSQDGLRESTYIPEGRLRHVRLSSPTRYIDLVGGQEVKDNTLQAQGGHWMDGGSYYCLYREDGNIARFTSLFPGTGSVPQPQPAVVKLGKKGFFSGKDTGAKESPAEKKPAVKSDPGNNAPADEENAVEQIPSSIGNEWTPAQTDNTSNEGGANADNTAGNAAGAAAAGAGVVGALGAFGAYLMMKANNMGLKDVIDGVKDLFETASAPEPETPRILFQEPPHKDGEVNDRDEVWSDEDRGWVGRNLYEQEKERRKNIDLVNEEALRTSDKSVKEAFDQWQESKKKLEDMRAYQLKEHKIEAMRLELDRRQRESDRGASWTETISDNLERDWKELKEDCGKLYDAATDANTYSKIYEGSKGLRGKIAEYAWEAGSHPWDTTIKVFSATGKVLGETAAAVYEKPELMFIAAGKLIEAGIVDPILAVTDKNKRLSDRLLAVAKLEVDYALMPWATTKVLGLAGSIGSRVIETVGQTGGRIMKVAGKAGENLVEGLRGLGLGEKVAEEGAEQIAGKGLNPALSATEKRLAFLESSDTLARKAKMMENLNQVADAPEGMRMFMLNEVRKEDPAIFNLVRKELHPETAAKIGQTLEGFNQEALSKTSQALTSNGYVVKEVKLAGNVRGADCDSYWKVVKDGRVLSEAETRKVVDSARKGVFQDEFGHLRSTPDELGHKTMNASPEKFAAEPGDLGIQEVTIKPKPDGTLDFDQAVKAGPDPARTRGVAQAELMSDKVATPEVVHSVGEVLKTKTDHLKGLGRPATTTELRDMAREITKTGTRTVDALTEKTGASMTPDYQALRRQLALVAAGDAKGGILPTLDKIDAILAGQIKVLQNAVAR